MTMLDVDSALVGLIGWGQMGGAIGNRLLARGQPVVAYDTDPQARAAAEKAGANIVGSPGDVVEAVETFITMLPDDHAVRAAFESDDGIHTHLHSGQLWIEMSSALPSSTAKLAREVASLGVSLLDAPVTGGVGKARTGELTVIAAGPAETLEHGRPILRHVAAHISHVSEHPGGGDLVKTVNNMLSAANLVIAAEGLRLAEAAGIDPDALLDVINNGTGQSNASSWKIPTYVLPQRFDSQFALGQYAKDLDIAMRTCRELAIELGISAHVEALWRRFVDAGHGDSDHTFAVQLVREGHESA